MDNALEADLELYTCLEPIGPEHTPQMLVDNMFIGIERGIYQHAAMRRVAVPGSAAGEIRPDQQSPSGTDCGSGWTGFFHGADHGLSGHSRTK